MKLKKLNQKGVAVLEIILIIFVIGAVAGIGYYVWQAKIKTNKTLDSTAQGAGDAQKSEKKAAEAKPKDETEEWYLYVSPGKEFQLRLPDGWKLDRYLSGPGFYAGDAKNIVYSKGTAATVTQVSGGRDFSAIPLGFTYAKTTDLSAPQGDKQASSLKTKQGITIDKYKYLVTTDPEAIGPPKDTTEYTYRFTKGSYSVNVVHDVEKGGTEQTTYIEKALQTFEFL